MRKRTKKKKPNRPDRYKKKFKINASFDDVLKILFNKSDVKKK